MTCKHCPTIRIGVVIARTNTKPLKFDELSQEARDQWGRNGTDDYRDRIQCCFNCPHWHCVRAVDHEYAWNPCLTTRAKGDGEFVQTKFDYWCPDYAGQMSEQNLVWVEEWQALEGEL